MKKSLEYTCECGKAFVLDHKQISEIIVNGHVVMSCACGCDTDVRETDLTEEIYILS